MLAGQIVNGLIVGSMYALIALGFTLVIGLLHRLNFAHTEMFMAGGFVGVAVAAAGMPIWLAVPASILAGGLGGLAVERIAFRGPQTEDANVAASLTSLAVGLVLLDLTHHVYGTEPVPLAVPGSNRAVLEVFGVRFTAVQLAVVGVTVALVACLHLVMTRTRMGREIRAVADNPAASSLLGVDVRRVVQRVFFISSALACVAGLLLALRLGTANSDIGLVFGLKALAVMAIGGMADLRGAIVGGLLVGLIEAIAAHFGLGRLAELSVWACMILFLLFRPEGLFGAGAHGREVRA